MKLPAVIGVGRGLAPADLITDETHLHDAGDGVLAVRKKRQNNTLKAKVKNAIGETHGAVEKLAKKV